MTKNNLPNPDLDYSGPLELTLDEAALALHALRGYISAKGAEVSDNTRLLENKLESFVDRCLGPQKLTVEIDE